MGMVIFPFIAKPVFVSSGILPENQFAMLMEQRKVMVPVWIKMMLETKLNNT